MDSSDLLQSCANSSYRLPQPTDMARMGRPKISFAVRKKRKASELLPHPTAPATDSDSEQQSHTSPGPNSEALRSQPESHITVDAEQQQPKFPLARAHEPSKKDAPVITVLTDAASKKFPFGSPPEGVQGLQQFGLRPFVRESGNMAEPPAKRAKRTDSSAMWDRNDRPSRPLVERDVKDAAPGRERREDRDRDRDRLRDGDRDRNRDRDRQHDRDDRRHWSRSRDKAVKRRERSRSQQHDGGRHTNGDKGREARVGRDRRDRERSMSRDRHRSRRGRVYGQFLAHSIPTAN